MRRASYQINAGGEHRNQKSELVRIIGTIAVNRADNLRLRCSNSSQDGRRYAQILRMSKQSASWVTPEQASQISPSIICAAIVDKNQIDIVILFQKPQRSSQFLREMEERRFLVEARDDNRDFCFL